MSHIAFNPFDYLKNPVNFTSLRAKARKYFWENGPSNEESSVIQAIIKISPGDPKFSEAANEVLNFGHEKVETVIRKLMAISPPLPPKSLKDREIRVSEAQPVRASFFPIESKERGSAHSRPRSECFDATAERLNAILQKQLGGEKKTMTLRFPQRNREIKVRRAKTVFSLSEDFKIYPEDLHNIESMHKLVEGAICLQYLFTASFNNLFKDKKEKEILEKLIDLYLTSKLPNWSYLVCLEKSFREIVLRDRKRVEQVFEKLMKKHTITKVKKSPQIPMNFPLPTSLTTAPFDTPSAFDGFIALVTYVQFECVYAFRSYSAEEVRIVRLLQKASVLRDFLRFDFQTALRTVLASAKKIADRDIQSLIQRTNMGLKSAPDGSGDSADWPGELRKVLQSSCFINPHLFDMCVENARAQLPTVRDVKGKAFYSLLIVLEGRKKNEHLSLDQIIQDSLTLIGLRELFHSEKDGENVKDLRRILNTITPRLAQSHPYFESEAALINLIHAARSHVAIGDLHLQKVIGLLTRMGQELDRFKWDEAVLYFVNHQDLRVLFENENDLQNSKELVRCIEMIVPRR